MRIRYAVPEDAADVYGVHASVGGSLPWSDAEECRGHIEWMIGLGVPPFVAEVDGRAVAEMAVWWGQDVPELGRSLDVSMIEVHTDYHRRGIGRALMQHAVSLAREKACERVSVWTDPDAVGFYGKIGFESKLTLWRHTLVPANVASAQAVEFRPGRLTEMPVPDGAHMQTGRIVHPRQRWHNMLRDQADPPRWKGAGERRQSILASAAEVPGGSESAIAVYRLCHWRGDASQAELYLWSPTRDASVVAAAVAHAARFGIGGLSALAYGEVAGHLSALGATVAAEELNVLALDRLT